MRGLTTSAAAVGVFCLCLAPLRAGPPYSHTQTVTNNTGVAANDLHIAVTESGGALSGSSPTFTTSTVAGGVISFSGGSVANGGSTSVTWTSNQGIGSIDSLDSHWTDNGFTIAGGVSSLTGSSGIYIASAGPGDYDVSFNNTTGGTLAYNDFAVYTGADSQYYNDAEYYSHLSTGTTSGVTLQVPSSGTLAIGTTLIATVHPVSYGYTGGSANIGGGQFGEGVSDVPEPGTSILFFAGVALLLVRSHRVRPLAK